MTSTNKRGGSRPNSGRKRLHKTRFVTTLTKEDREALEYYAITNSTTLSEAVSAAIALLNKNTQLYNKTS